MVRFSWVLALLVVGGCAAYAALVLATASWPEAAALRDFYIWQPRAFTQGEFEAARRALGGLGALALGGAALGLAPARGRAGLAAVGEAARQVGQGLRAGWRDLSPGQRRLAGASLALLTLVRAYYSVVNEPSDDGVSYEVFVRARLLLLSAAYPMPNNHVGSNTLDWLFYQVNPGFWFSMRLPVLLTSTAATGLWFLALLRRSNFRVALPAVWLFSWLQLSLYHATSGRGYLLLVGLSAVGFFAVLALAEGEGTPVGAAPAPAARLRLAWVALVGSGVVGLYAVPTQAYFLASAYGWLGLALLRRRAYGALARAVGLGALTLLGAGLLYAPLLLISGPQLLFHNEYVQPLAGPEFWRSLPRYLWLNEGWLSGHRWLGVLPGLATLGGVGWLGQRARAGRLPAAPAAWLRRLGLPAAWMVVVPYALVLVQRVQPPERTLFYKAQLQFVLVALLLDAALRQLPAPAARRRAYYLLGAAGLLFAGGETYLLDRYNHVQQLVWQPYRPVVNWLAAQPAGPVLAPEPAHRLLLRFYAHTEHRDRAWLIDDRPRPGVHYRYLVSKPGAARVPGGPAVQGPPALRGAVDIYVAP